MQSVREWLFSLKAADVMTTHVVALRPSDRLAEAAGVLLREQISGAPVVDDAGACVGVISATDVLSYEQGRTQRGHAESAPYFRTLELWESDTEEWSKLEQIQSRLEAECDDFVDQLMTPQVVSVPPDAPLASVVRRMIDAHVHRVLVLDAAQRLQGIITTTDVLAALLRAAELSTVSGAG